MPALPRAIEPDRELAIRREGGFVRLRRGVIRAASSHSLQSIGDRELRIGPRFDGRGRCGEGEGQASAKEKCGLMVASGGGVP